LTARQRLPRKRTHETKLPRPKRALTRLGRASNDYAGQPKPGTWTTTPLPKASSSILQSRSGHDYGYRGGPGDHGGRGVLGDHGGSAAQGEKQ
jgi:hypothetical protein